MPHHKRLVLFMLVLQIESADSGFQKIYYKTALMDEDPDFIACQRKPYSFASLIYETIQ